MRTLSTLARTALSGGVVIARWIFRITLPGGTFGASDGPTQFVWNNGTSGNVTFEPLDAAAKVTIPALQTALRTDSALVQVSATDPMVLTGLLGGDYRAAPADIALLLFDPATGYPGEEFLKWRGKADQATIVDEPIKPPSAGDKLDPPSISTLSLSIAPQTIDMKRGRGRMATDTDQRLFRDANDSFFQDVALVGVSTINWGQAGPTSPAASAFNHSHTGAASGIGALAGAIGGGAGGARPGMKSI